MKSVVISLVLMLSAQAHAHFELGTYKGKLASGAECRFEINSVRFINNLRHPLNEVVHMKLNFLNEREIDAAHLAIVDAVAGTVRPKPQVLSSTWATPTGAEAVELVMNEDGPTQIIHLVDNYRNPDENQRLACTNLQLEKK